MDTITLTYDVPVSRAAAFYLFVEGMPRWWPSSQTPTPGRCTGAAIEPRVGGALTFRCGERRRTWGEVVDIQAQSLTFDCWRHGEWRHPSRVTVTFSESEWGARITFEHGGWSSDNAQARSRYGDWPLVLAEYVAHARRHAKSARVASRDPRGVA